MTGKELRVEGMTPTSTATAITSFQKEFRFLSNFYIEPDGTHVEGEYQARKLFPPALYVQNMRPAEAKAWGSLPSTKQELRKDWEQVNVGIMQQLVTDKFMDHKELSTLLLATGERELVEGNWWGDRFWGVCNGVGQNEIGKILMMVRAALR